jgi:hypothetical protein
MSGLVLLLANAASGVSIEDRTLPFGCNDAVVVGRVESHAIEPIKSEGDQIGHGWVTATISVKRVVKGRNVPRTIPVMYFAHTFVRGDRDFMLVLHQTDQAIVVTNGRLMSVQPLLADRCH